MLIYVNIELQRILVSLNGRMERWTITNFDIKSWVLRRQYWMALKSQMVKEMTKFKSRKTDISSDGPSSGWNVKLYKKLVDILIPVGKTIFKNNIQFLYHFTFHSGQGPLLETSESFISSGRRTNRQDATWADGTIVSFYGLGRMASQERKNSLLLMPKSKFNISSVGRLRRTWGRE